jgi:hypothetical protein
MTTGIPNTDPFPAWWDGKHPDLGREYRYRILHADTGHELARLRFHPDVYEDGKGEGGYAFHLLDRYADVQLFKVPLPLYIDTPINAPRRRL